MQIEPGAAHLRPTDAGHSVLINRVLLGLGLVGLFISGVLSYAKYTKQVLECGVNGGCQAVSEHPTAYWFTIPVAYFGLAGFLLLTGLAALRELVGGERNRLLVFPGYLVAVFGFLISVYLQYTSFFVIRERCTWCISSAVTMLLTLIGYTLLAGRVDDAAPRGQRPIKALPIIIGALFATGIATVATAKSQTRSTNVVVENATEDNLVPQNRHQLGPDDAVLTIVEFADFCCPACRTTAPEVKKLVDKYPGKVRLIYRHLPFFQIADHKMAIPAAIVSEYAAEQGKFWEFHKAVMATPEPPKETTDVIRIAGSVGLDVFKVGKLLDGQTNAQMDVVYRDLQAAQQLKLTTTPSFLVFAKGQQPKLIRFNSLDSELASGEFAAYVR